MKSKITSNLMLKIISLVAAFLFWLVIINITDPTTSKTFFNIPVKVVNENVITSVNQVYEIAEGDTVNVTVKGKRSFVETLTKEDFTATADLSRLSKVNAVSIDVALTKTSQSGVELDWNNAVMKVNLEKRVTQNFKVEIDYAGELSDGYVMGEIVAKPNIVEVSCGESKFKRIDHVGVLVDLNGESEDFEAEYTPVLYDEEGEKLDNTNVSFGKDSIRVSIKVLATKEIPVHVETTGTPAEGYRLVQTDYKPETIRVSGSAEAMDQDPEIRIPISVEGAVRDVEKEVQISDYLPKGMSIEDSAATISVRCVIEKDGKRKFTLNSQDIAVKNLPGNCTMNFEEGDPKYTVTVTGKEKNLQHITLNDLGAYIDLANLAEGSHTVEVHFSLPAGVVLQNQLRVRIVLDFQEKSGEDDEDTPATKIPMATVLPSPAVTEEQKETS